MFITLYVPQHYSRLTCIVFVGNYSICCDRSVITLYIMFILLTSKVAKTGDFVTYILMLLQHFIIATLSQSINWFICMAARSWIEKSWIVHPSLHNDVKHNNVGKKCAVCVESVICDQL